MLSWQVRPMEEPKPEAANSALAEIQARRAVVQASDRLFRPALLVLAADWVAGAIFIVLMSPARVPVWVGPIEGVAMGLFLACAIGAIVYVKGRQHAYSRTGDRLFRGSIVAGILCGTVVMQLAFKGGWLGLADPLRGLHFVLVAAIATVPLLLGALVIGWRR